MLFACLGPLLDLPNVTKNLFSRKVAIDAPESIHRFRIAVH